MNPPRILHTTNSPDADLSDCDHLYPFRSFFLEQNGWPYHYIDQGSGDPVVMVHGNPTWSFYFRSLINGLTPRYRTIAVDHIGCGLSGKPSSRQYDFQLKSRISDLKGLLDHLAPDEKITLILHDWGGMIGMAYAVQHPQKIGRIVIMNTAAFLPPQGKKPPLRLRLIRRFGPLSTVLVLGFNLFCYGALYTASYKRLSKEVKSGLIAPYNSWNNRLAVLKFVQDIPMKKSDAAFETVCQVERNLYRLAHIPMLICWGRHDFVFDEDYLAEWQRRFPDAQTHIFDHAGHFLLEDEPNLVLRRIDQFLTNHPLDG